MPAVVATHGYIADRRRCAQPDPVFGSHGTEKADPATLHRGDAVLDVTHITRWAGCIGNRSTVIAVADAKHDAFLSLPQPRQMAYRRLDLWLDDYLGTHNDTDASASSGKG